MELIDFEEKKTLSREEAAKVLSQIADSLARHNSLEISREGMRYTVKVPNNVELEVEYEIDDDGGSLEIEISW